MLLHASALDVHSSIDEEKGPSFPLSLRGYLMICWFNVQLVLNCQAWLRAGRDWSESSLLYTSHIERKCCCAAGNILG